MLLLIFFFFFTVFVIVIIIIGQCLPITEQYCTLWMWRHEQHRSGAGESERGSRLGRAGPAVGRTGENMWIFKGVLSDYQNFVEL